MPQHNLPRVETTSWLELFARYQERIAAWTMLIARLDDEVAGASASYRVALRERRTSLRAKRDATVHDVAEKSAAYLGWLDAELELIDADARGSAPAIQARIASWAADLRRDWETAHHALQSSTERYIRTLDAEIGRMQVESADGDDRHLAEIAALHAHQQDTWRHLKRQYEEFRQRREALDGSFLFSPASPSGYRLLLP